MDKNNKNGGLKLLDAVEALSKIAETPWEQDVYEVDEIDINDPHWLQAKDKEGVVDNIKSIFRVILNHLKDSYQEQYRTMGSSKNVEGIKTIMVIVGEAAKKIDRYTDLFHTKRVRSITEIKEYRQLQEFYNKKISKTINEAVLSKWILALSQRAFETARGEEKIHDTKHVFVDLDSVKNDTEYELFFIRKSDGTRFFSPRLIRNIKLICNFGVQLGKQTDRDPLIDLPIWQDYYGLAVSRAILNHVKPIINQYYPLIIHHKETALFGSLHKALLALILASNENRLISAGSSKGCSSYLADFQIYLREALESRTYQQMVAFPHQEFTKEETAAKKILDGLIQQLFEGDVSHDRLEAYLKALIKESNVFLSLDHRKAINLDTPLWSRLSGDFIAMQKFIRYHANGHLNKLIANLEEGDYSTFDPYQQMCLPEQLYRLGSSGFETCVHALASPTKQEVIDRASIIPEWLGYLHAKTEDEGPIVLINHQDNTSWREYARAHAIENLQEASGINQVLTVLSLPKDTEFYNQQAPYDEDHQLVVFKKHLLEQVLGNHTGFYFPESIRQKITQESVEGLFLAINRVFFSNKNVLSKEARLDFIEIFYLFLELKILEITKAKHLFFTCKDGIDISPTSACSLFALLKMLEGKSPSQDEIDALNAMIYKPALLRRERVILQKRMERMLSSIKVLENAVHDYGSEGFKQIVEQAFSPYYQSDFRKIVPYSL